MNKFKVATIWFQLSKDIKFHQQNYIFLRIQMYCNKKYRLKLGLNMACTSGKYNAGTIIRMVPCVL